MRLRFSRTADYGLRATLEVARAQGRLVPRRELSTVTGAPLSVLAQPLAALARADVLAAQAGPRGGYRLARPARDISVYDVVLAIDGEGRVERCVLHEGVCSWEGACPFHAVLAKAQERFTDTLRSTSLEDVLTETPLPIR
ncbi:MAG TPA: Rrf2 family transcriptional regulator [Gaiella sp.]|uniref:RrF2 family transcriptional regulator n=1 Tax=Gaiella sp. TaxID=2663207 RepID=UPI002D7E49E6|nr:Rrf2 family transcriptional regulator [Gaiella sp.]HET9287609.1 Rrf2 family transcriptional regulator [Gaiella sp.]